MKIRTFKEMWEDCLLQILVSLGYFEDEALAFVCSLSQTSPLDDQLNAIDKFVAKGIAQGIYPHF